MVYGFCNLFCKKKQTVVVLKPVAAPRCKICLSTKRLTVHRPSALCNNDTHRVCFHCLDKIQVYFEYCEECVFCYYEKNLIKL